MGANEQNELESIKRELQRIINELDSISRGVRKNFEGIGNERCASSISAIADDYRRLKRQLDRINLNDD